MSEEKINIDGMEVPIEMLGEDGKMFYNKLITCQVDIQKFQQEMANLNQKANELVNNIERTQIAASAYQEQLRKLAAYRMSPKEEMVEEN